ncbi:MAG TPA: sigma-70 family RNA polymerase sigma factor [Blastocatellia bacterium]|nr:sigma-70 family RNA polymerase sigma factor [Blastocatellia bacterium]
MALKLKGKVRGRGTPLAPIRQARVSLCPDLKRGHSGTMTAQGEIANETQPAWQGDAELVRACLDGNPIAWEALLLRYRRLIYSIPLKAQLGPDDAADVFQSVCLTLYEKLPSLRDPERLAAWLITTTTRECWRLKSRRNREDPLTDGDDETGTRHTLRFADSSPLADEAHIRLEQQQLVRDSIEALPERCRELIRLLFYEKDEWSYDQIARRMRMPAASIGPTRARCLKKLQKIMEGRLTCESAIMPGIPFATASLKMNERCTSV